MIIARISRYATKERVLGNSWLLKLFMVPMEILFLTYFWKKRPIFDQKGLLWPLKLMDYWVWTRCWIKISKYILWIPCYYLPVTTNKSKLFPKCTKCKFKIVSWAKNGQFHRKNEVYVKIVNIKCHFLSCFWKKTILIWTYFPSGQFWPCIFIR